MKHFPLEKDCVAFELSECLYVKIFVTEGNKILWPKLNRNRISATILVSAKTEILKKNEIYIFVHYENVTKNYKL